MSLRGNRYLRRPGGCRPADAQLKFSCPARTLAAAELVTRTTAR
jgi:hypothetical protein